MVVSSDTRSLPGMAVVGVQLGAALILVQVGDHVPVGRLEHGLRQTARALQLEHTRQQRDTFLVAVVRGWFEQTQREPTTALS